MTNEKILIKKVTSNKTKRLMIENKLKKNSKIK